MCIWLVLLSIKFLRFIYIAALSTVCPLLLLHSVEYLPHYFDNIIQHRGFMSDKHSVNALYNYFSLSPHNDLMSRWKKLRLKRDNVIVPKHAMGKKIKIYI